MRSDCGLMSLRNLLQVGPGMGPEVGPEMGPGQRPWHAPNDSKTHHPNGCTRQLSSSQQTLRGI